MSHRPSVYVLVSYFDCVDVSGVYTTLDVAQHAAEAEAEQPLVWHAFNRGEASDIIPPFSEWTSGTVQIEGEDLRFTISKCPIRETARL